MPIVVTLDVMLARRKMSLITLCERTGFTLANISFLKAGKARGIRFSCLEKICIALKCQPADLIVYMDQQTYEREFAHWINKINRGKEVE